MRTLATAKQRNWYRQVLAALVFSLLALQFVSLTHAADDSSHTDDAACQICHLQQPTGTVPTPLHTPVSSPSISVEAIPARRESAPQPAPYDGPPPSRAPPK